MVTEHICFITRNAVFSTQTRSDLLGADSVVVNGSIPSHSIFGIKTWLSTLGIVYPSCIIFYSFFAFYLLCAEFLVKLYHMKTGLHKCGI